MKKVDYSSEAITRRLKQVDQLRVLCLSLEKAKKVHDTRQKDDANDHSSELPKLDPDMNDAA